MNKKLGSEQLLMIKNKLKCKYCGRLKSGRYRCQCYSRIKKEKGLFEAQKKCFFDHIIKKEQCWIWIGAGARGKEIPRMVIGGIITFVKPFSYKILGYTVPKYSKSISICKNNCVNPRHLMFLIPTICPVYKIPVTKAVGIKKCKCETCTKKGHLHRIKFDHDMDSGTFANMVKQQRGKCAICGIDFVGNPAIDHDHKTKKIRGLLCKKCNSGLGFFNEKKELLLSATLYLNKSTLG